MKWKLMQFPIWMNILMGDQQIEYDGGIGMMIFNQI